ncbi:MAG TPA: capsule assembly Wzi family protein [Fodinibius sp.]|nr:capsule assembly Wzi family protein [Fodinibius sp.]
MGKEASSADAVLNFHKRLNNDQSLFDYGFGATFVGRYSDNKTLFFSQLYGKLGYGVLQLTGGRFYEHTGTVNPALSMGSLAISPNATPMPKIKLAIPNYTEVPFTSGFVEFKGAIAHGWFGENRIIENAWLHEKYAYLRFGGNFPFRPYIGLIHQATWGGQSQTDGNLPDSFSDYWDVLMGKSGGDSAPHGDRIYRLGDHRGIWDMGFYLTLNDINFLVYRQFIYDDKDGLKLQEFQDGLLGVSVELPGKNQQWVTGFLWEYLYTKKQGGPRCPGAYRDEAGGCDNYYNNYLYQSGWTYAGNTIGNPLFVPTGTPGVDVSGLPGGVANNRIIAHHFGLMGHLSTNLDYKLLATWSRNYGIYKELIYLNEEVETEFDAAPEQWSFLAQFNYHLPSYRAIKLHASIGYDTGELYENRIGLMFGIEFFGTSPF